MWKKILKERIGYECKRRGKVVERVLERVSRRINREDARYRLERIMRGELTDVSPKELVELEKEMEIEKGTLFKLVYGLEWERKWNDKKGRRERIEHEGKDRMQDM